jgi:CRISPR-associated protein Cas8a1/Csx13
MEKSLDRAARGDSLQPKDRSGVAMKMTMKLNAPGMTSLHKAGLAGLYLTLRAFEETGQQIKGLGWELEPTQVTMDWQEEKPQEAFAALVTKSFWLDDGFIRLTGLEASKSPTPDQKHHLYTALLNSFMQFGPHRPTGNKQTLTYEIDDRPHWIKDFAPIKEFRHQFAAGDFIDDKGYFKESIEAAGWLYPGGGQRHVVHNDTKLNEPTELALALLFAPMGVIYYTIKSRARGRKARLAMLVPEIKDLALYADIRQTFAAHGVFDLTASSASDAALRMLTMIKANEASNILAQFLGDSFVCRVITFGIVSWNEKQKSRTYTRAVFSGALSGFENYRKAAAIFKNRWQRVPAKRDRRGNETEPERFFVTTFSAREFIADNIAQGRVWYQDLATYLSNKETREQLQYERKELSKMVEVASYDDESERLFIRVCHESWRRRLGKLGERATRENASFSSLVKREAEKLRTSLSRCKNADTLRETVVDFWARAGASETLRGEGLTKLLPLFAAQNWKKTRDLALLALISYQPQSQQEEEALTATATEEGENNE